MLRHALAAVLLVVAGPALAYDGVVEKQTFAMPAYTTVGGQTIKDVRVGWESYGKLNAARDNAILITHFYSGTSHAAGKYKPEDKAPGYWDAIIGAGKPIDTDKYFVLSSDTLVNLNAKDPTVVTTGPASIDPATGKPYGMRFPIVTIRDFVNVQKALVESLGIAKLHAVVGASMGALQAFEWAAAYPDMVGRIVPVIPAAEADAWLIGWMDIWSAPIRLDPNWKGGDYYGGPEPVDGLTEALKIVTLQARHPLWATEAHGRKWAVEGKDPAAAMGNRFAIEAWLEAAARGRAKVSDANHFLYLAKANQLFVTGNAGSLAEGLKQVKAPVLLIPSSNDLLLFPAEAKRAAELLRADGGRVEYVEVDGKLGHVNGVALLATVGDKLAAFLAE